MSGRIPRVAPLLALGGAVVAGACVDIALGPNGVQSMRWVPVPPSIIAGDTLRDSLGVAMPLQALAFDDRGAVIAESGVRFGALSLPLDTTDASKVIPITVDSLTGVTVALGGPNPVTPQGRVQARIGDRLQVIDTIDVVRRPLRLSRQLPSGSNTLPPDTLALFYDCRSDVAALQFRVLPDSLVAVNEYKGATTGNVIALPIRVLTGDSSNTSVPIRRFLVDYQIDSVNGKPASTIPNVTLSNGSTRPAIGLIARSPSVTGPPDSPARFDTTDQSGNSRPRLRIFPSALGPSQTFPDTIIRVVVSARAHTTAKTAVVDTSRTRIVLRRFTKTLDGAPLSCTGS